MRFLAFLMVAPAIAQQASLVLVNGRIWTGTRNPAIAEAVACHNGRIMAIGSTRDIRALAGAGARIVDLGGRLVVPGFNDSHVHFITGGENLSNVQLRDARSETEFRDRIAAFAKTLPQGRWITGGDWDHELWQPARLPTRALIDAVTPDHPVFVNRLDGHMALANSLALKMAGITRATADPPGGTIVRDSAGDPAGVLKDSAMGAVARLIPPATDDQLADHLRAAMRHAAERGVTSVQDMSASPAILRVYQKLLDRGEMNVRVYAHQPLGSWQRLASAGIRRGFGGDALRIGALKGFSDGSLGSTTALFFAPYSDAPGTSGLAADDMIPESKMRDNISGADAAGLQIAIHAIGDRANSIVLGMFAEIVKKNGNYDRRFRIEHAQHLRREEAGAFARQNVIASMQPYHAIDDGRWAEKRIGAERSRGTYAFRWLIDAGATLAFGSDWPVAPLDPLLGIYAAATRRTIDGKRPSGWVPEQKITVEEALRAYTRGSAYASFEEASKGTIEAGKLADMAVLSDNILQMDSAGIEKVRVVMTIFNGRVIFE